MPARRLPKIARPVPANLQPGSGAEVARVPIRVAEPGDSATVATLIAGFRDYYGESEPPDATIERVVEALLGDQRTEFLLAGEPPLAVAQLRFRPSVWTGVDDAWLEDLFVQPAERGGGVGRALADACVQRARERGCKRIQLDANERNAAAVSLYESLGFRARSPGRWDDGRNLYYTKRL
jgi:ribosomal protein S18 acetylase RimI-like enzyme